MDDDVLGGGVDDDVLGGGVDAGNAGSSTALDRPIMYCCSVIVPSRYDARSSLACCSRSLASFFFRGFCIGLYSALAIAMQII